jgi:hypothetical protein
MGGRAGACTGRDVRRTRGSQPSVRCPTPSQGLRVAALQIPPGTGPDERTRVLGSRVPCAETRIPQHDSRTWVRPRCYITTAVHAASTQSAARLKRSLSRALASLLAAAAFPLACGQEAGSLPLAEGERCGGRGGECLSDEEALVCEDRVWAVRDCAAECEESGLPTLGCLSTFGGAECVCDADGESSCGGKSPVCTGSDELATCVDETWAFTNCSDHCAALDPSLNSVGCAYPIDLEGGPACACTYEGTPCTDEEPVCDNGHDLARCEDGAWKVEWCSIMCEEGEVGSCDSWADGGAQCKCEPF